MSLSLELWLLFGAIVSLALFVDLGLLNNRSHIHAISLKEAALWSSVWMLLAAIFGGVVFLSLGKASAQEYFAAYLVEQSLSVDNMFVFVLIFHYFHIPAQHQPRALKYGILGAIVMRFAMIFSGVALLQRFHWIFYLFGGFLLFTSFRMALEKESKVNPEGNPVLKLLKRFLPVSLQLHEERFLIRQDRRWHATPLLAALLLVEVSDLIFAMDSIPAVLALSTHPFIIFTSNVFAILGLRSIYFMVSHSMGLFRYLKFGLSLVLGFIGLKLLVMDFWPVPISVSLTMVVVLLTGSIVASILIKEKKEFRHDA